MRKPKPTKTLRPQGKSKPVKIDARTQHLRDLAAGVKPEAIADLLAACEEHDKLDPYERDAFRIATQKIRMLLGVCEPKQGEPLRFAKG